MIIEVPENRLDELNVLISDAFEYSSPNSFLEDFPVWASDQVTRLAIEENGKLISHVGIRFVEMKVQDTTTPMALVGGVATHPDHRAKGHGSRLLKEAIQRAKDQNCDWAILWGSEFEFYKKLGFELEGQQCRIPLNLIPGVNEASTEVKIHTGMCDGIFNALAAQTPGLKLNPQDASWFQNHKTVQWFYTESPFAFAGFERGIDLKHIVHEWGGDHAQMLKLFKHVHSLDSEATLLGRGIELLSIGANESNIIVEYLCLAKPLKEGLTWNPNFWISGLGAC